MMVRHKNYMGMSDDTPLTVLFKDVCTHLKWAADIDHEFQAQIGRESWTYIGHSLGARAVTFKWEFKGKKIDSQGK